jgi:hypothetical protein
MSIKIEAQNCTTARELIDYLNPLSAWRENLRQDPKYSRSEWLYFRGQFQSEWGLVPSALRPASLLLDGRTWKNPPFEPVSQVKAEANTLWAFLSLCDDAGLALPEDGQTLRRALVEFCNHDFKVNRKPTPRNWPPPEVLSFMAFAQHSGIPTRLLDFTTDGYVAAYFAAKKALESEDFSSCGSLSIWCIPSQLTDDQFYRCSDNPLSDNQRVQIVTAPSHLIQNLRAQKGLFLYDQEPGQGSNPQNLLDALPLDSNPALKLTLPHSEADQLLLLLRRLGYHTASLFPSPEQIVQGLKEIEILNNRLRKTAPAPD